MSKHLYRTLLIWAAIVMALVYVYPTVGWLMLSEESRLARLEKWQQEDDERAKERPGYLSGLFAGVKRWAEFDREKVINLGLDLQGGIHMVIGFDIKDLGEETLAAYYERGYKDSDIEKEIQDQVLQQIQRRINDFEAKEPIIQTLGSTQIQVQLPGEKDLQRAKKLITRTAQMNFHLVAGADEAQQVFMAIRDAFPEEFLPFIKRSSLQQDMVAVTPENRERIERVLERAKAGGTIPEGKTVAFSQAPKPYDKNQDYQLYVIESKPLVSGTGLTSSSALPDQSNPPYWQILFGFNAKAAADFADATGNNIGRNMAIVLDGVVVSAPTIQDRIAGGRGQITGSFEDIEARDLSISLNSGSMVVPVREEFTRTVSASLGQESIQSGLVSSIVGTIIVALFMMVYYRVAGIVAVVCLTLNGIMILAAMAYFGLTLTLPGIAGLVLTMGMAVDTNVIIYERLREELKRGHTLLTSVNSGFRQASTAILDANVTTLIAALVLLQFGTGPIQGFAVTLSIGVCTTVFTGLFMAWVMFEYLLEKRLISKVTMMSIIPENTNFSFMAYSKMALIGSALVIVFGLCFFGVRGKDNFGVDFQEGTNVVLRIDNEAVVPVEEVRTSLVASGFTNPVVQETSGEDDTQNNMFVIRVNAITGKENTAGNSGNEEEMQTVAERIQDALAPLSSGKTADNILVEDEQTVGSIVGAQLRLDALSAMFWALIFILIYLWIRFEIQFAIGTIMSLTHDVLVAAGIFSLLGGEISMSVIAALLTLIGYSLNDTIVVFDRVREDMRLNRGKGLKFTTILDGAISSTLSRTILTSLTVFFVLIVLFFFGGESLRDFTLVMIIGVIAGTYSTIFIAAPITNLAYEIRNKRTIHRPTKKQKSDQTEGGGDKGKERRVKKSGASA